MNRRSGIAIAVCLLLALAAYLIVAFAGPGGERPFADLKPSDVASASVRLLPPDRTLAVEDTQRLVRLLNRVVIDRPDAPESDSLAGQSVIISISLTDGSRREIVACNPYLAIDGGWYQAKYRPCEALNRYANELAERKP